ncbi:MAG: DUF3786 domain-containing protein [Lachnospiraceae bacterium]|nr:DUF3786 domain-containing protein [Lachnospiraceae bacterium]
MPLTVVFWDGDEEFGAQANILFDGDITDFLHEETVVLLAADLVRHLVEHSGVQGCYLCPRECGAKRREGQKGVCKADERILVARASLHMWEEPCISGEKGSGTVFFSGCSLGCVYCQNERISGAQVGYALTTEELAKTFLVLQEAGAENINLVTPSHYAWEIREALLLARQQGLKLPIVYNCSGYEKVETLRLLEDVVDIYLTDFKYMDEELAGRYSRAKDYPGVAKEALAEMVRQQGEPQFDHRGMMQKGVILRHLLLPGCLENGKAVVRHAFEAYGNGIFYSVMNQYTPMPQMADCPELYRKVTDEEYDALVDYALELGVENGFIQEGETAQESFIPDFEAPELLDRVLKERDL